MKKVKAKEEKIVSGKRSKETKKEKAVRPASARSANLGFHGRDNETDLNAEE